MIFLNHFGSFSVLAFHIDTTEHFGDTVLIVSLGSTWQMDFRPPSSSSSETETPVILYQRSLVYISDDARYTWRHGIRERKTELVDGERIPREVRISFTFRSVLQ